MAISAHESRTEDTTDSWITPKWLVDRLGPFDLDPCACIPQPWPCAARQYTLEDSGLLQPWDGMVWCNPPYGNALGEWLSRCALHGNAIAICFARTETRAFFRSVWPHASALIFIQGRIQFCRPDGTVNRTGGGNGGGPSVLIGYGAEAELRLRAAADLGAFVKVER